MKRGWVVFAALALVAFALYGCCKGCGPKLGPPDLDKVPGMKDSGIPDPNAIKEHSKEVEELSKKIQALGEEQRRISADPTLSAEEKQRRTEEISKQMEPLAQRMAELGGDMINKETKVNTDIEKWKKESGGK
jgi:hypothetical protein